MNNLKKGFSLVELLVVIAIIGILASVGVTTYSGYIESAKQGVVKSNQNSIVSYTIAEIARCQLGSGNFAGGMVTCKDLIGTTAAKSIETYITTAAKFENPGTTDIYATVTSKASSGIFSDIDTAGTEGDFGTWAVVDATHCNTDAQMGNIYIWGMDIDPGTDYVKIASCVDPAGEALADKIIESQSISIE